MDKKEEKALEDKSMMQKNAEETLPGRQLRSISIKRFASLNAAKASLRFFVFIILHF